MMGMGEQLWTAPAEYSSQAIPPEVQAWLSSRSCPTLATIEPGGRPQLSVVWAKAADGVVLMSTVAGRRKHQNLMRDPRATLIITPPDSQDHYVEMRGTTQVSDRGGRELIDDLHEHYRGRRPYPWDAPGDVRVVVALRPERVLVFHG